MNSSWSQRAVPPEPERGRDQDRLRQLPGRYCAAQAADDPAGRQPDDGDLLPEPGRDVHDPSAKSRSSSARRRPGSVVMRSARPWRGIRGSSTLQPRAIEQLRERRPLLRAVRQAVDQDHRLLGRRPCSSPRVRQTGLIASSSSASSRSAAPAPRRSRAAGSGRDSSPRALTRLSQVRPAAPPTVAAPAHERRVPDPGAQPPRGRTGEPRTRIARLPRSSRPDPRHR